MSPVCPTVGFGPPMAPPLRYKQLEEEAGGHPGSPHWPQTSHALLGPSLSLAFRSGPCAAAGAWLHAPPPESLPAPLAPPRLKVIPPLEQTPCFLRELQVVEAQPEPFLLHQHLLRVMRALPWAQVPTRGHGLLGPTSTAGWRHHCYPISHEPTLRPRR